MALSPEQREYVVRSVVRILKDVNRNDIIAALHEDVLATALKTHDKSERTRDFLTAAADNRRQRRDYAAGVQSRRIASEVRGDR